MIKYQYYLDKTFQFTPNHQTTIELPSQLFIDAINDTHIVIDKITKDIPVDVFSILGMRNLSAFVGEIYVKSIEKMGKGLFLNNPHQDGYPDLLFMDELGTQIIDDLRKSGLFQSKEPFSPFKNGGIEVKATVGSVPTPAQCLKKGITKPNLGDTRINVLKGYDWKAHHRDTNNLVGLLWDFIDGVPRIVAVFFGTTLNEDDWGNIVQPKKGGGRTTSVSIMTRAGVKKMYENCVCVIDDNRYRNFLNKYNKSDLL